MLSPDVLKKLEAIEHRLDELTHLLSDPAVAGNGDRYRKVAKERASLEPTVAALHAYRKLLADVSDNEALLGDAELREMAREELDQLRPRVEPAEEHLKTFLVPRDPHDEKDVIVEVRAGAGGDEAGLFAAELVRTRPICPTSSGGTSTRRSSSRTTSPGGSIASTATACASTRFR